MIVAADRTITILSFERHGLHRVFVRIFEGVLGIEESFKKPSLRKDPSATKNPYC